MWIFRAFECFWAGHQWVTSWRESQGEEIIGRVFCYNCGKLRAKGTFSGVVIR